MAAATDAPLEVPAANPHGATAAATDALLGGPNSSQMGLGRLLSLRR